jgi:hypothetical protein
VTSELSRVPSIALLQQAYLEGKLTPVVVVKALFERLRSEKFPGVFLDLEQEQAVLHRAQALEAIPVSARGALYGVPFAVKDNIDVLGVPTTAACPQFAYTPTEHAACVAAALSAGAIYIGKTLGLLIPCQKMCFIVTTCRVALAPGPRWLWPMDLSVSRLVRTPLVLAVCLRQ